MKELNRRQFLQADGTAAVLGTAGCDALVGPGDLPVTTDFRDVLITILRRHAPDADMAKVFPGHEPRPLGQAAGDA